METRKALVIGVSGQDGAWLAQRLGSTGYKVYGTYCRRSVGCIPRNSQWRLDLSDPRTDLQEVLSRLRPDVTFFLAGQSSVADSWLHPVKTFTVNTTGYARLLEAIEKYQRRLGHGVRVVHASSSEMFGESTNRITESTTISPNSPYAWSKASAHSLGVQFRDHHGLWISNAILFNHESTLRPMPFVFRRISIGVAAVSLGLIPTLTLGDLRVVRDWGSAREYVGAVQLIAEAAEPGDYLVATGQSYSLKEIVARALDTVHMADRWDVISVDPALGRSGSSYAVRADPSLIQRTLGWSSRRSALDVIQEMVTFDQQRLLNMGPEEYLKEMEWFSFNSR